MKRISIILIATLTFALLVYAQSRTPVQPIASSPAVQSSSGNVLTPAMRAEWVKLRKSEAGEAAVRAWAQKNRLEIVSQKGYDIIVIPERTPQSPTVQEASSCDPKKCPPGGGFYDVKNTAGIKVGLQQFDCVAKSCNWVKDDKGRWNRICGNWQCVNGEKIMY